MLFDHSDGPRVAVNALERRIASLPIEYPDTSRTDDPYVRLADVCAAIEKAKTDAR